MPTAFVRFTRHIGIDYSGAETPERRVKGLQVYESRTMRRAIKYRSDDCGNPALGFL